MPLAKKYPTAALLGHADSSASAAAGGADVVYCCGTVNHSLREHFQTRDFHTGSIVQNIGEHHHYHLVLKEQQQQQGQHQQWTDDDDDDHDCYCRMGDDAPENDRAVDTVGGNSRCYDDQTAEDHYY